MKFEKILHYVEKSFGGEPSFIILMSDGKEYISNGYVWRENTEENRDYLIKVKSDSAEFWTTSAELARAPAVETVIRFQELQMEGCEDELNTLLQAPPIEMKDVVDACCMFAYSNLTEFDADMSSVVNATAMFSNTNLTEFSADMSSVVDASYMFFKSSLTGFNSNMSNVVNAEEMFYKSNLTKFNEDISSVVNYKGMFCNSNLTEFNGDLSNVASPGRMLCRTPYWETL